MLIAAIIAYTTSLEPRNRWVQFKNDLPPKQGSCAVILSSRRLNILCL